jgi:hypothetical protein
MTPMEAPDVVASLIRTRMQAMRQDAPQLPRQRAEAPQAGEELTADTEGAQQ